MKSSFCALLARQLSNLMTFSGGGFNPGKSNPPQVCPRFGARVLIDECVMSTLTMAICHLGALPQFEKKAAFTASKVTRNC